MKKVKHHTIPGCYLNYFANDDGLLHVLDLKERKIFMTRPGNILTDTHFYTIKLSDGSGSLVVEDTLASIESEYSKLFHNVIAEKRPLERKERALVSVFVSAMLFRTQAFRKNIESFFKAVNDFIRRLERMPEEQKASLASVPRPSSSETSISAAEFRKMSKDIPTFHSSSIIEMLPEATNIIFNMKWGFLVSEAIDEYFITSDNPCVLMNVPAIKKFGPRAIGSSPGLLQDDVDLTLPLSSKISLLAGWKLKKEVYTSVPIKFVDEINNRVAMHAHEKLISCSAYKLEDMLKRLKIRK
jgi:hypothetical protein